MSEIGGPGPGQAVFLDRDGVINRAIVLNSQPYPPASLAELEVLPGVPEALTTLQGLGLRLLVVTNQPDVARGRQSRAVVEAINERLMAELPLDAIYVCYHDNQDHCDCRKPAPGLILQAANEWKVLPAQSFMVGDRSKDIEAGRRAGCTTFLIDLNYAEPALSQPDYRVNNLLEATQLIQELIKKESN